MNTTQHSGEAIRGAILDYIHEREAENNGIGISFRDITEALDISSVSVTSYHLRILKGRNAVTWEPDTARSIRSTRPIAHVPVEELEVITQALKMNELADVEQALLRWQNGYSSNGATE